MLRVPILIEANVIQDLSDCEKSLCPVTFCDSMNIELPNIDER